MSKKYDPRSVEGKLHFGAIFAVLIGILSGCGYSLQHRLKEGFDNPIGLYVPVFENTTDEIGAERVFTDAFIRELQSRGGTVITQRKPGAYEVRGVIQSISYTPTNLTPMAFQGLEDYRRLPTEIVVEAGVGLSLVDPATQKVFWSGSFSNFRRVPAELSRTKNYQSPSSLGILQQSLIESQYPAIARDIMRDVYDSILEQF